MDPDSTKPSKAKVRSGEDFDILIGILGFWVFAVFVLTVFLELTGRPALLPAMILLALVLALWGMIRLRRRFPARRGQRQR